MERQAIYFYESICDQGRAPILKNRKKNLNHGKVVLFPCKYFTRVYSLPHQVPTSHTQECQYALSYRASKIRLLSSLIVWAPPLTVQENAEEMPQVFKKISEQQETTPPCLLLIKSSSTSPSLATVVSTIVTSVWSLMEMGHSYLETATAMTENWNSSLEPFTIEFDDFDTNDICSLQELPYIYIFIPALYFIIFFLGFFGNLYVILLMARKQGNKRLVDTFVLNLAVADLVFVCTLPFWAFSQALGYWCFGEGMCKFSSYAISVNRCSSILFLMGMSMERFFVMVKSWDSRSIRTKSIVTSCACVWIVSFLLGIPSLIYRKLIVMEDTHTFLCQDEELSTIFSLILLILTFLLPLGVILFCYCSIWSKLRGHISLGKRRNNALKIIFAIIGAFICSWLPFNTFKAFFNFSVSQNMTLSCQAQEVLRWGLTISACLSFTNSCINPIIYVFMDQQFRQQALKNFPTFCNTKEKMQNSPLSFSSTDSSLLFGSRKKLTPASSIQPRDTKGTGVGF